jgi:pyruvate/2-oxoglutarate dehydrogenase complex dihydrolipoamide acyltransferase (E2) component
MSYYFVNVPKLPKQVSHQLGTVELVEYRVGEGEKIETGQTIAIVQNWWAKMVLKAVGPGYVSKTFFTRGTRIKEGDPLAIIVCDPDDGPKGKDTSEIEIIESIRAKSL